MGLTSWRKCSKSWRAWERADRFSSSLILGGDIHNKDNFIINSKDFSERTLSDRGSNQPGRTLLILPLNQPLKTNNLVSFSVLSYSPWSISSINSLQIEPILWFVYQDFDIVPRVLLSLDPTTLVFLVSCPHWEKDCRNRASCQLAQGWRRRDYYRLAAECILQTISKPFSNLFL